MGRTGWEGTPLGGTALYDALIPFLGSQGCLEGVTEDAAGVDTCGVLGLSGPEKSREKVCRWRKRAVDQRTACSSVLSPCLPEAPLALAAVTSDTAALVVLWC